MLDAWWLAGWPAGWLPGVSVLSHPDRRPPATATHPLTLQYAASLAARIVSLAKSCQFMRSRNDNVKPSPSALSSSSSTSAAAWRCWHRDTPSEDNMPAGRSQKATFGRCLHTHTPSVVRTCDIGRSRLSLLHLLPRLVAAGVLVFRLTCRTSNRRGYCRRSSSNIAAQGW